MENIFKRASSNWAKYSEYILAEADNGVWYVMPAPDAKVKIYNILENYETMVIDALNVGLTCMNSEKTEEDKEQAIFSFISNYGLLGLMTALPTTSQFMNYDAVYLNKNQYIKEETMQTEEYLKLFFPFKMPNINKRKDGVSWTVGGDKDMMALALTMDKRPMAVNMGFQKEYAERYDWIVKQFKDWAFTFFTSILYYEDFDSLDDTTKNLYRQSMAAFDGIAPTYHIELLDTPTMVWDFHSLLLGIQMMFSFMLVNDKNPLRICKHCNTVFKASRPSAVFCSPQCKNRYNVYKSRKKDKKQDI
jgi:hypothetical protein